MFRQKFFVGHIIISLSFTEVQFIRSIPAKTIVAARGRSRSRRWRRGGFRRSSSRAEFLCSTSRRKRRRDRRVYLRCHIYVPRRANHLHAYAAARLPEIWASP